MTTFNSSQEQNNQPSDENLKQALGQAFGNGGEPSPAQLSAIRQRIVAQTSRLQKEPEMEQTSSVRPARNVAKPTSRKIQRVIQGT